MKKSVFNNLFLAGFTAIALSACGSSGNRDLGLDLTQGQQGGGGNNFVTPPPPGTNPADTLDIQLTGTKIPATTTQLYSTGYGTDNKFKVRIRPLPTTSMPIYSGQYRHDYSCISLNVKVNGVTKSTGFVRVDGMPISANPICGSSVPTEKILDFSNVITGSYVNVTITDAAYDYARFYYGQTGHIYGAYGMSTLTGAFYNDVVNFNATFEVDGTYMPE